MLILKNQFRKKKSTFDSEYNKFIKEWLSFFCLK